MDDHPCYLPAGGMVGSDVDGAAAVSVGVGFGAAAGVAAGVAAGFSVLVPLVPPDLSFFRKPLTLSMASSGY
jgi:hypothetical protein